MIIFLGFKGIIIIGEKKKEPLNARKKIRAPPNVAKVLSNVVLKLHNVRIKLSNVRKNKRPPNVTK